MLEYIYATVMTAISQYSKFTYQWNVRVGSCSLLNLAVQPYAAQETGILYGSLTP